MHVSIRMTVRMQKHMYACVFLAMNVLEEHTYMYVHVTYTGLYYVVPKSHLPIKEMSSITYVCAVPAQLCTCMCRLKDSTKTIQLASLLLLYLFL